MQSKKFTDIYGTEVEVQNTPSDYFRLNFTKGEHDIRPEVKCVSLGYDESVELYKSLQIYLKERDLLPKNKKK